MSQIIKTYVQNMPNVRLCGLSYRDGDRKNGGFFHLWKEWFESDRFNQLNALNPIDPSLIGCMRVNSLNEAEYWIGVFLPRGTAVPKQFEYADIAAAPLAVCWIKGQDSPELYSHHVDCVKAVKANGWEIGNGWFFERYTPQRFCQPDPYGNVILDYCIYLDPASLHE